MRTLLPSSLLLLLAAACTPSDGTADPTPKPDPNEAPGAPQVALNAASPATDADLVVVFLAQSADPDGDDVSYRYTWFQDGAVRGDLTTDTVPASETTKGQIWRVAVTPNDGALDGPVAEASATVVNTPPRAQVSLPASVVTSDDLVATASATDLDDDAVTFTYAWTRDGAAQDDLTGATVPAARTAHGEVWTVTATPNDGEADGAPASASVTIANTAPSVAGVRIDPTEPRTDDTLVATVEGAEDVDGDDLSFTYDWYVDDTLAQSGPDDTLAGSFFAKHQLVRVEVLPDDGMDPGARVGSEDVLVANTAPYGISANVSPGALVEASTATCVANGWTDADGDSEGWTYDWRVNSVAVGAASTLDGASFSKGDVVACVATPFDGEASGTTLTASSVRVANTAPTLASAALSTTAPTESDTVSVTVSGAADADGDTVSYQYAWRVNGTLVGTSSTLSPSRFAKGNTIDLTVTPTDGTDLGAAVSASTAIVADSPPVVTSVSLTPSTPTTNSVLTASATTTDADSDSVSLRYAWSVNGVPTGTSGSTLNGATYFDRDDVVTVSVTPNDGERDGTTLTSSSVTVRNTAPTAPGVAIEPVHPLAGDVLMCDVTAASTDADGDSISYTFSWMENGRSFTTTSGTAWGGDTVPGAYVQDGDVFQCTASASDDSGTSGTSTSRATVGECGSGITDELASTTVARICASTFTMGCTAGQPSCEADETSHNVTLTHDFWIGSTEVTQNEYVDVMGVDPSYPRPTCSGSCPVTQVTWHMAAAYANAVSAREGLASCYTCTGSGSGVVCSSVGNPYSCVGYRLPTEAEWEGAARCGSDYPYAGSTTASVVAWYSGNSGLTIHDVATRTQNACGVYDMSGNVWEWVEDWYGTYTTPTTSDPYGAPSPYKIYRGGGAGDPSSRIRVADRAANTSTWVYDDLGFRIARTLP